MDPIGILLSWLAIGSASLYIVYQWWLVAKQRKLKPQNAAAITLGTALLIIALPTRFYSGLSAEALNQLSLIGVAAIIVAFLIDPPWKKTRTDQTSNG